MVFLNTSGSIGESLSKERYDEESGSNSLALKSFGRYPARPLALTSSLLLLDFQPEFSLNTPLVTAYAFPGFGLLGRKVGKPAVLIEQF